MVSGILTLSPPQIPALLIHINIQITHLEKKYVVSAAT
jgi:hypothetical protein